MVLMKRVDFKCAPVTDRNSIVRTHEWWGVSFNSYTVLCIGELPVYVTLCLLFLSSDVKSPSNLKQLIFLLNIVKVLMSS